MPVVTYRDPVMRMRQRLATSIAHWVKLSGLTQVEAGVKLHLTQQDVSRLIRGDLRVLSAERLLRSWTAIGGDWDLLLSMTGAFEWPPPE